MSELIDVREGRALFGGDVNNYNASRPPYPEAIYESLTAAGALRENITTLEIGAGNGLATRRLCEFGVQPLTVIEPDERFAPLLTAIAAEHQTELHLITAAFEEAQLPDSHFDLVVAATAFHWVDPATGLTKVAQVLKPGGYVALWWHVFGDPDRADPFHEATYPVLKSLSSSPGDKNTYLPFALDTEARRQDFARTGQFEEPTYTALKWTLILNPTQVAALYGTYSGINRLPTEPRQAVLDQLTTIAETEFNGRVTRNMVSPLYLARRR